MVHLCKNLSFYFYRKKRYHSFYRFNNLQSNFLSIPIDTCYIQSEIFEVLKSQCHISLIQPQKCLKTYFYVQFSWRVKARIKPELLKMKSI